ncbi:MAG: uracil-DNA glycosylase [Candidatus Thiodiazotropha taylori]|uniref:Type-4 uracil-DNA glycosylase n=1 Tax=Candidatus Thiodiazotropha taylori TaxID=2792791 RepID=A0A9E4KEV1_9GAMM|nr:uracil-DNA glycosylase [Candidatus Thiodiazotropha taylori]MCG8029375.1 uracil-DNA glycosylase [Candidatus Thiodiazotropha taylori]MCG8042656.1 uracil-DNA glycosylase [Candidatus Thiodiazotropha taylori]MCG8055831.1 uracil-DNA glycosylase [Candidatus Thiodiazotropha taylori]MCG8107923.1 uracil-DNA glycosylase [Candidatus Thiodiazotropha taylori]
MDELRRQNYLRMMGVTQWRLRHAEPDDAISQAVVEAEADVTQAEQPAPVGDAFQPTESLDVAEDRSAWLTLRQQVKACRQCGLRAGCSQTVFGVGDEQADLLVIGEAPGADEDRQGEPFVGRAGQLLNGMLLAMGFKREAVFIANIVKCRPPDNRDPAAEEALACQNYLLRQIALIQPKLILSVGRISAQNLLQTDIAVGKLRGRVHTFGETNIPLVVTYHPAYLLRSPEQKSKAWQDLQLALSVLGSVSRDQGQA